MRRRLLMASIVALLLLSSVSLSTVHSSNAPSVTEMRTSPLAAHFPQNKHNESPIAVNPIDPQNVITGSNDESDEPDCTLTSGGSSNCPFDPNANVTGVYTTLDGGASWTRQILHWNQAGIISDGDPVVAFGPKPNGLGGFTYAHGARAYFASLAGSASFAPNQEAIAVAYSDDNGLTWSTPVIATNRDQKTMFNDKVAIAVDANQASPYFGQVYVSWTLFRSNGATNPEPIMFTRSLDGGNQFDNAQQITGAFNNGKVGGRQGSVVRAAPDGTVYLFWDGTAQKASAILGAKSESGDALRPAVPGRLEVRSTFTHAGRQLPDRLLPPGRY